MKCRKRNAQKFDVNVSQKTIYLIKLRLIITFIDFFFLSQFKIDYILLLSDKSSDKLINHLYRPL